MMWGAFPSSCPSIQKGQYVIQVTLLNYSYFPNLMAICIKKKKISFITRWNTKYTGNTNSFYCWVWLANCSCKTALFHKRASRHSGNRSPSAIQWFTENLLFIRHWTNNVASGYLSNLLFVTPWHESHTPATQSNLNVSNCNTTWLSPRHSLSLKCCPSLFWPGKFQPKCQSPTPRSLLSLL